MLAIVLTANTERIPMTMTTTTVWTRATACADDVQRHHGQHEHHREELDPELRTVGHGAARVAAERHRDHAGDDGVGEQQEPRDDPGDVSVAEAADDVFEQSTRGRVASAELRERVALQARDGTGDHEGHPHRGTGDFPGGAEEREDPGTDHRADPDECGLADGEGPSLLIARHVVPSHVLMPGAV